METVGRLLGIVFCIVRGLLNFIICETFFRLSVRACCTTVNAGDYIDGCYFNCVPVPIFFAFYFNT
jgi:hypothetical protein